MVEMSFQRLEDFISLAKTGEKVNAEITLRKEIVTQKVHPQQTEEMKSEKEMYLLIADFAFNVKGNVKTISKSYMYGSVEESITDKKLAINIANARLKMDYDRLKEGGVIFEEKYFE